MSAAGSGDLTTRALGFFSLVSTGVTGHALLDSRREVFFMRLVSPVFTRRVLSNGREFCC